MLGTKEIKRRIRSVISIQQITRAMQMIAVSRLKKAEDRLRVGKALCGKDPGVHGNPCALPDVDPSSPAGQARGQKHRPGPHHFGQRALRRLQCAMSSATPGSSSKSIRTRPSASSSSAGRATTSTGESPFPSITTSSRSPRRSPFRRSGRSRSASSRGLKEGRYDEVDLIYTRYHSAINTMPMTLKLLPLERSEVLKTGGSDPGRAPL